ncbi:MULTISPECIES: glucosyl-3-phosphoglycerate synthase [Pseudonocardia]|uniref:Glucosyl-3-phosphoglycerate synthase n=2 Tax=Pseudonocardia TaxID=1847 RepID=A0A1Y2MUJ7_PSEAH|nr:MULTISPECIES: glucosyl-3-phosphoglycerate synthase [Pseudonocardia]OSY38870.1 Glucosyl-3-phosphoglycerate synthase [Pseudonocardia autotrophica]TDN76126.1 glucosyl-3-phosphoglycerate synthase [Pseudonocardia autotrophica]BBG00107.1 hypothetical protein Pdca_13160 [Pseudonocardia autotrophica]GEC26072.1 hypothetical protein PSA01_31010 [Pseudonocardia saturnea]
MDDHIRDWFDRRTWHDSARSGEPLRVPGNRRTVSVVLPALDEEATVGELVAGLVPLTSGPDPLVGEVVVVDSGSTDRTREVAATAGARVVTREQALPEVPVRPGKGEVLWRSLAATTGDVVVFVDSDLVQVDAAALVRSLLEPLLQDDRIALVKGFYRRPLRLEGVETATGGGRVTELTVRPLLAALQPDLAGVIQPLGGEYAATRELLESLPFAAGYGVEIGLLIDTLRHRGLDAIAQVDLGVRKHRNRTLLELGVMARQIVDTVLRRECPGGSGSPAGAPSIVQFGRAGGRWVPQEHVVDGTDRPPMCELRPAGATARAGMT